MICVDIGDLELILCHEWKWVNFPVKLIQYLSVHELMRYNVVH